MNSSQTSYHESPQTEVSLSPAVLKSLRFNRTEDLESEARHLKEIRLEHRATDRAVPDLEVWITAIDAELERRHRLYEKYQDDPMRPAWPDMSERRYEQLLADARELKALWSLSGFLTTVVGMQLHGREPEVSGDCPFHQSESGTSFKVSTDEHVWFCHGCQKGGDLYRFVGENFGILSFPDQVRKVEEVTDSMVESARIITEAGEAVQCDTEAVMR